MKPKQSLFQVFLDNNLLQRRGPGEVIATNLLIDLLTPLVGRNNITIEEFKNCVPLAVDSSLMVDGKSVTTRPISFKSGKLDKNITAVEFGMKSDFDKGYIAYNMYSKVPSLHTFFSEPSVAISNNDIKLISNSKSITGFVEIEPYDYVSRNILIGNITNPEGIIFSHIDTVESGFIDNLTGVAAMYDILKSKPNLIDTNLFVFSGNEELSYDGQIYWGKGYRDFENRHKALLDIARQIHVIDCIGQTPHVVHTDRSIIDLAFPLGSIEEYYDKTQLYAGDMDKLMSIYHSDIDNSNAFNKKYYDDALKYILQELD